VSTYVAVNYYGASEINRFTDTGSLSALAIPEMFALIMGVIFVHIGCKINSDYLTNDTDWEVKAKQVGGWSLLSLKTSLVFVPILVAFFRSFIGINNIMVIFLGSGITSFPSEVIFSLLGIPRQVANLIVLYILYSMFSKKFIRIIFKVIYSP
jgi:hypothetical protein